MLGTPGAPLAHCPWPPPPCPPFRQMRLVPFLCAGALVGGAIGAHLALGADEQLLKQLFAAFLAVSAGVQLRALLR
jgi:hypothetical protein